MRRETKVAGTTGLNFATGLSLKGPGMPGRSRPHTRNRTPREHPEPGDSDAFHYARLFVPYIPLAALLSRSARARDEIRARDARRDKGNARTRAA